MTARSVVHATFVIERAYGLSPARVWEAWAEPAAKASWFGPKDLPHESRDFDFRVGGQERFAIGTPAEREYGTRILLDNLDQALLRETG
jgi:uncharacterized protein YndB with AHSA1/START domain